MTSEPSRRISASDLRVEDDVWYVAELDSAAIDVGVRCSRPVEARVEKSDAFPNGDVAADLMNRCLSVLPEVLPEAYAGILADMQDIRAQDWAPEVYGDIYDEVLPPNTTTDELRPLLWDPDLVCRLDPEGSGALGIGIAFKCEWDAEHGTDAVVRVDAPGTAEQAVSLYEAGGGLTYGPFD